MSELIDIERLSADMRDFQNRVWIWRDEAEDTETRTRADAALATIIETKLILDKQPTIPAQRWHRVEEPPKKHGKYPVCWIENGNFYWQEAHYCYYQDGDKWVAWSSYQGDDVEITPDYWMPIEPPKEDADARL